MTPRPRPLRDSRQHDARHIRMVLVSGTLRRRLYSAFEQVEQTMALAFHSPVALPWPFALVIRAKPFFALLISFVGQISVPSDDGVPQINVVGLQLTF